MPQQAFTVGIGGPVGSGKTALVEALCRRLSDIHEIAVITNDIYTKEDAEFLVRREVLLSERVLGVETGSCPHTAIREDATVNLEAIRQLTDRFPDLELILLESGGDTWRRRSVRNWWIPQSTSSTWPRATRFPAKADPPSRGLIFW